MNMLLAVVGIFLLLAAAEIWWRRKTVHDEFSRKLIHITVGSFVAFWPYFLSWGQIQFLSLAFLVVVGISKRFKIFKAIHSVQRPTWGEVFFAIAVGALTLVTHDKAIYAAALLQMSLADGLAAVWGVRFGKAHSYLIFGHRKSLAGTAVFFVTSLLILIGYDQSATGHLSTAFLITIAALASGMENVAVRGLDNLLVPLTVALLLVNS